MDTDFPVWTGEHFLLRYLQSGDAVGLFTCYHDKEAVRFMNADNCIGGFYVETPGEMQSMADWWLKGNRDCLRLTILHLPEEAPVGTAEVCGKDGGLLLLRVDIAAAYETEQALCEILGLCIDGMFALFPSYDRMWVKAIPQAVQRVAALRAGSSSRAKGGAGGIIMRSSAPTAAWATAGWCAPIAPNGWAVRGAGKAAARKRRTAGPIGAA